MTCNGVPVAPIRPPHASTTPLAPRRSAGQGYHVAPIPWYIVLPFSKLKQTWDNAMVAAMLADVFSSTYLVAYENGSPTWVLLLFDGLFLIDILLSFVTGYVSDDHVGMITELWPIGYRYLTRVWEK